MKPRLGLFKAATLLGLALGAGGCEPPTPFAGADRRQNTRTGRIEGRVVVTSAARGPAVIFLYDFERPPPPAGSGRPVSFTVVTREELFGAAPDGDTGPFTAPYTFSLVPPGRYLIRALLDANDDFIPWYTVTSDANAGDVGGAAVDALTRAPRVVAVEERDGVVSPALDVPVSITDAARVAVDRPVFLVRAPSTQLNGPTAVDLETVPIQQGVVREARPVFLARLVDDDSDGRPDDANGDGVPDFWPRVVVRKLASGDNLMVDENDLDRNGVLDATGVDYEHAHPVTGATIAADGAPDLVVLAAAFDPTELLPQLFDASGRVKQTPTPVNRLRLVLGRPPPVNRLVALDAANSRSPAPLRTVPSGRYSITVIQSTGQTWRVPNELAPPLASRAGLPEAASQLFAFEVP